jgi:hypothetical protein
LKINEVINWKIPDPPGTQPIPDDHVRLYHQTDEQNLGAIKHQGIRFDKAQGIEGPKAIWADERGFYGKPTDRPTVEFHVHRDRWKYPPFVQGDVLPKDIIAVHRPWHERARYNEQDPELIAKIVRGDHDDLLNDPHYAKQIRYIKHKYAKRI